MVVLAAAFFSGVVGGAGALVTLPLLIAMGLSPQQAIAVSKFSSFGINIGATVVFKKRALNNPRLLVFLIVLAFGISLMVPYVFSRLDEAIFQTLIGVIILASVPLMLIKKHGLTGRTTTPLQKAIGGGLMAIVLGLQGVFSGGVGTLQNAVLVSFFGLSTLQANAVKRLVSLVLNTFIVLALIIATDYMVYELAIAGFVASLVGGYAGSRIAVKKGEGFARYALVGIMLISGIGLLVL